MSDVLNRGLEVQVINDMHMVQELALRVEKMTTDEQKALFAADFKAGFIYLYQPEDERFKDVVFETVQSMPGSDLVMSLYRAHPVFASKGELLRFRRSLIDACAEKIGLSPEGVGIADRTRGRMLGLEELATGQLIDLLAEKSGVLIKPRIGFEGGQLVTRGDGSISL